MVWPWVVRPPAQVIWTATRSLVPATVMATWVTSARMSCLRSAWVVVGAAHRPSMSPATAVMACCWAGVSGWGGAGEAIVVLPQLLLGGQRGLPVGFQLADDQAVLRLGQPIAAPRPVGADGGAFQALSPELLQLGPLGGHLLGGAQETSTAAGART
jgi:hypothetical protein